MWKLTAVTASVFIVAACDTTEKSKIEQAERLERAKAEAEAIAQVDDARCQSYGAPGTNGYFQCRTSLMNGRRGASDNRLDAKKP
jgi:hypothetical protein